MVHPFICFLFLQNQVRNDSESIDRCRNVQQRDHDLDDLRRCLYQQQLLRDLHLQQLQGCHHVRRAEPSGRIQSNQGQPEHQM